MVGLVFFPRDFDIWLFETLLESVEQRECGRTVECRNGNGVVEFDEFKGLCGIEKVAFVQNADEGFFLKVEVCDDFFDGCDL